MDIRRNLLWVDSLAGLSVGVGVLLLRGWLSDLYGLPEPLLLFMGVMNLVYGSYSFSLAIRARRPMPMLVFLVVANLTWSLVCVGLAISYRDTASIFGLAQFAAEALFVGGLGVFEWRWRRFLLARADDSATPITKPGRKGI